MSVRMTYKKGIGKDYEILSQSGSSLVQKFGFQPLLDNEKTINDPAKVTQSWFSSANYEMHLKPGVTRTIDGRTCLASRHQAPPQSAQHDRRHALGRRQQPHTRSRSKASASKSPSVFAGTTRMMRRYTNMQGYAMATHARAESSSMLFGLTVVTIDYSDYHFDLRPTR